MKYSLGALIPVEALPVILVVAGILMMIGMRRLAGGLILFVLADAFLLPFAEPLMDLLPTWLLVLITVLFVLGIFRELVALLIGKGAADTMIGALAADFVKLLFFFPRLAGRLLMRLLS